MAVTAKVYGNFLLKALNKEVDFDTDTIKIMLLTALTIDQDGDIYLADVTKTEVANGNGYTTGGQTLTNCAVTYTGATNVIKLDADNAAWTSSTISATHALIFDYQSGVAATAPVIAYIDFGATVSSTNGTFTVAFDAAGIATITVS